MHGSSRNQNMQKLRHSQINIRIYCGQKTQTCFSYKPSSAWLIRLISAGVFVCFNWYSVHYVRFFSVVQVNDWWFDRLAHTAQLEKLSFSNTVSSLSSDNVTHITLIFHLPNQTTAEGIPLARTQSSLGGAASRAAANVSSACLKVTIHQVFIILEVFTDRQIFGKGRLVSKTNGPCN